MICVCCQNPDRDVETGQVCPGCAHRIACDLRDIADLYVQVSVYPGSGAAGPRVSGSREAPLPLRVDALDLTMPARGGTVHDLHGDQIGHVPAAAQLDDWVRDWAEARREGLPTPTVPVLCAWLANRLPWACQHHPAVDVFAADMARLRATLRAVVGDLAAPPQRLPVPCSYCDLLTLVRFPAREARPVGCRACGRWWTEDEYAEWTGELAHAVSVPAEDAKVAA